MIGRAANEAKASASCRFRQKAWQRSLPGRAEARLPLSRALALPAAGPGTNPLFVARPFPAWARFLHPPIRTGREVLPHPAHPYTFAGGIRTS
jgi:hypothetical protein